MDASVMDGQTLGVGGVAAVGNRLAQTLLRCPHYENVSGLCVPN